MLTLALRFLRKEPSRVDVFQLANTVSVRIHKIHNLIDQLVSNGFIRQDSRDTKGPYHSSSTYYTVSQKRDEIDSLLAEDVVRTRLLFAEADSLHAAADDRIPFCPRCLRVFRSGSTYCRQCLNKLEKMDLRMIDIIIALNKKGYKTVACCAGHPVQEPALIYISFNKAISEDLWPEGFKMEQKGHTLRSLSYHKTKGITLKKMRKIMTEEIMDSFLIENLNKLRSWVQQLPENNARGDA